MTPLDAAALAILALEDRPFSAAILRALTSRATAEDCDALPPLEAGEPLVRWFCRCRSSSAARGDLDGRVARVSGQAHEQLERAARLGVRPLPFGDAAYPPLLAAIADPPPMLWTRGEPSVLSAPAVAVVGSRAATPYGLLAARQFAADLTAAGLVVVSGLARGVDAAAHVATVTAGGRTVAVLGCGVDRIYPREHADLAGDIERAGAIVSEFPPGTPPLKHHFPLRNRIISGLAHAVVVAEAPEKSGALITASAAADQGREVMVVPGQATGRNRGGHLLIRDGARLVESVADLLQDVPTLRNRGEPMFVQGQLPELVEFTADDVSSQTGEPAGVVLARLLELELAGRIQRLGGGRFARVLT